MPGTTWDYWEDNLTVHRLEALSRYWRDHPPTHVVAAAFAGIKPQKKQLSDVNDLLGQFQTGQVR